MNFFLDQEWQVFLQEEFAKPYFNNLVRFVTKEYENEQVFPPASLVYQAFNLCALAQCKVVILGQDPYHDVNQAHGLCFSVPDDIKKPPSLVNIFKELSADLGIQAPTCGNLEGWAMQGVLLLNATLTVRAHEAASHQNKGWELFTDSVIQRLSESKEHLVFFLWGNSAHKKVNLIDSSKHLILCAAHPSPLSAYRGFFGNGHFSKCNTFLLEHGAKPIQWV